MINREEEIRKRAYKFSEYRRHYNLGGDETSDWLNAERSVQRDEDDSLGLHERFDV